MVPGLATKWTIDPANNKRWIFELRKGVKFHDGCEFNADLVVWNIQRLLDDKTPGFHPVQYARQRARSINIERAEKIDDGTVAIYTKTPDSLAPYNLSIWYMISKCALEKVNYDYAQYARPRPAQARTSSTASCRANASSWSRTPTTGIPRGCQSTTAWC
jgi:peptide/nickel transport system substrate-binding protein